MKNEMKQFLIFLQEVSSFETMKQKPSEISKASRYELGFMSLNVKAGKKLRVRNATPRNFISEKGCLYTFQVHMLEQDAIALGKPGPGSCVVEKPWVTNGLANMNFGQMFDFG